ncbi:hypothetical protein E2C01_019089 [Portunus trituberculatus]|uniref:Uncharacterized protein n=1 Tax=Portunus trituberculatus TaxID=210409 RepID=A0A5B7DXB6_PORTR|nr:hypothetical protein [Portunus trituberculatus]
MVSLMPSYSATPMPDSRGNTYDLGKQLFLLTCVAMMVYVRDHMYDAQTPTHELRDKQLGGSRDIHIPPSSSCSFPNTF